MTADNYKAAFIDNYVYLKLSGRATYITSTPFDSFVQKITEEGKINSGIVDLSSAEYIDSTNLGIIAKFAIYFIETGKNKAIIYSPENNITVLLKSMGFEDISEIVETVLKNRINYNEISESFFTERNQEEIIIDAHSTLARMNEKNRQEFQHLVEMLKNECKTCI